jgi:hypothetical protein
MMRRSRPTHDHIHVPDSLSGAVDYLEDNEYRRNTLPKSSDWVVISVSGLAQSVYNSTIQNGGVTMSLDGHQPSDGYAHSLDVANEVKVPLDDFSPEIVDRYIQTRHPQLAQPDKYVGTWTSNGTVFLDISQVKLDHDEAYAGARDAQQEAMWDIVNDREIPITENSTVNRPMTEDWLEDATPAGIGR